MVKTGIQIILVRYCKFCALYKSIASRTSLEIRLEKEVRRTEVTSRDTDSQKTTWQWRHNTESDVPFHFIHWQWFMSKNIDQLNFNTRWQINWKPRHFLPLHTVRLTKLYFKSRFVKFRYFFIYFSSFFFLVSMCQVPLPFRPLSLPRTSTF